MMGGHHEMESTPRSQPDSTAALSVSAQPTRSSGTLTGAALGSARHSAMAGATSALRIPARMPLSDSCPIISLETESSAASAASNPIRSKLALVPAGYAAGTAPLPRQEPDTLNGPGTKRNRLLASRMHTNLQQAPDEVRVRLMKLKVEG